MSTSSSAGKKYKYSRGGTGATPVSKNSTVPSAKKQLMVSYAGNIGGGGKARTPCFTKDVMEVALKRIQLTLWEARDKRDLYWRCGLAGHQWMFKFCLKDISLS